MQKICQAIEQLIGQAIDAKGQLCRQFVRQSARYRRNWAGSYSVGD